MRYASVVITYVAGAPETIKLKAIEFYPDYVEIVYAINGWIRKIPRDVISSISVSEL